MLVLTRKLGESIYLYIPGRKEPAVVTVVDIDRGKIRLGIDADKDIKIYRQELLPIAGDATPPMPARED